MRIKMYKIAIRFVSDAKGPLDDRPRHHVVTLARSHEEAATNARRAYADHERAGLMIEYQPPAELPDTIALESFVFPHDPEAR